MERDRIEMIAFVAGSMVCLSDETEMEVKRLTEIIGIDALDEILDHAGLRFAIGSEDMALEIHRYCGLECSMIAPHRDVGQLDKAGTAIAYLVEDLCPEPGTEVNALFAVLTSRVTCELLALNSSLACTNRAAVLEAYLAEAVRLRAEGRRRRRNENHL